MSIVGEVILAVIIEMLFKKLGSEVLPLFGRQEKIRADLLEWQRKLKKIKTVLDDAEEKQLTDDKVKEWLGEIKNLVYDVEDVLDEFATKSLKKNLLHQQSAQSSTSKFRNLIPTCCTNLSTQSIGVDSKMRHKIHEISRRLHNIETEKNLLELNENSGGRRSKKVRERLPTTSLVNEDKVFGREKEKTEILELLLRDDLITEDGFSVIPIIAMGGMGKTTLAQLLYNDESLERHFDFKVWVCVSEDFDVLKVTKTILCYIDDKVGDDDDLNRLQEKLKDKLLKKKFFLVLDDLWNEDRNDWELLSLPFRAGSPGSKIIVTTRVKDVATNVGTMTPYELNKLSDGDCFLVFTQHSLGTRDFSMHQHLKAIGENIVKKCDGLPLAAKTLGGLLYRKYERRDWERVLDSKIWELPEEKCGVMKALRVSYHYLPAHLKRCYAYCSLLPKDYEFHKQEIVLLWMVEGLLKPDTNNKKMEESGSDYFQELQSRSFFQQSSMDTSRFVMHDLINDLAQWAAGEIYIRMDDTLEINQQQRLSENLRHLSYIIGHFDGIKRFEAISNAEHLRTFLPTGVKNIRNYYLSSSVVHMLLKLQRLRVLSLRGYQIFGLPNSIGDLNHLRHLDLSETPIVTLPDSINALYNLQVLLLENCKKLKKLCADMGNLINLRHVNNSNVDSLEEMPKGIGRLTCLQTLCCFVVGQDNESGLTELKFLKNLQGKLKILRLENVKHAGDAKNAELNGKKHLDELFLEWTNSSGNFRVPETETDMLDMLRPNENLKELTIKNFGGTKFPIWFSDSTLLNLVLLRFEGCDMCTSLPTVGQLPYLKHLSIDRMAGIRSVGPEFYGSSGVVRFPSLETLCFKEMQEWKDWVSHDSGEEVEVFPRLQVLSLENCSNLVGKLPERLPSLKRLVVKGCEQLSALIPSTQTLCELEINGCTNVVWRNTIDSISSNSLVSSDMSEQLLAINNNKELTYLWQTGTRLLQGISSLQQLKIARCPRLLSLVADEKEEDQQQQGLQCRLHYLELRDCQSLVKLPQVLSRLSSLKEIKIASCNSLESLPEAWMHNTGISLESLTIESCNSLTYIAKVRLPPSLKRIQISGCENLRTLIDEDEVSVTELEEDINSGCSRYTSVLEQLDIKLCPSLTSFLSKSELPATLKNVSVGNCSKLACLSSGGKLPKALQYLRISECNELESLAEGLDNNTSLETITITSCHKFRLLPENLHKARQLRHFELFDLPNVDSFPEGGLKGCTKLTHLSTSWCSGLKAIPNGMHNLTSLQYLRMTGCESIESFPEDSFHTNLLSSLAIDYIIIYKQWRLHRFTSLTELQLHGECVDLVSFPPEDTELALPSSLKDLSMYNFKKLKRLSSIAENLTSLEFLSLRSCPKLEYFPDTGLPSSLLRLQVVQCPLISKKFKEDKGQYWPLIAHLPRAYFFADED